MFYIWLYWKHLRQTKITPPLQILILVICQILGNGFRPIAFQHLFIPQMCVWWRDPRGISLFFIMVCILGFFHHAANVYLWQKVFKRLVENQSHFSEKVIMHSVLQSLQTAIFQFKFFFFLQRLESLVSHDI